ncbi:MAG: hypothetical protein ACE5PO_02420 [Candidatus Bathyarchaeia archaeon]
MFFSWRKKKPEEARESSPAGPTAYSLETAAWMKIEKSLAVDDVGRAKTTLRLNSVERDIMAEALTRLYEATAEGRLTPEERDRLASKYREQLNQLDTSVSHSQQVINLHELEETRNELIKLFQDKFGEINVKISDMRKTLGVTPRETSRFRPPTLLPSEREKAPTEEITEKPPAAPEAATPPARRRRADEELRKLTDDLRKELERLEQMELEG